MRLADLVCQLGLDGEPDRSLRYQLSHRAVSALREARRYRACEAMLLVHAFAPDAKSLADFKAFAAALGLAGADADAVTTARDVTASVFA